MDAFYQLLSGAAACGASDIHLKTNSRPVFRVGGELLPVDAPPFDAAQILEVVQDILPPHLKEKWMPDREADFSYLSPEAERFRVNIFLQRGQLSIAMRSVKTAIPDFHSLGLPAGVLSSICEASSGLILISGKTGTGKSTTLAACVEHINSTRARHIVMLEDPIEYHFEDKQSLIEQREIGLDSQTFTTALRHVARQDPDIIVIGEMRDADSFLAGINAAETGHLVLATLHSNNVRQSVERTLDFFPRQEREQVRRQLGNIIEAIICQRLVPAREGDVVPALEILRSNEAMRKLFETDKLDQLSTVIHSGADEGMVSFNQSLYQLVKSGVVSEEAALAKSTSPEQLKMNLRGLFTSQTGLIS